MRLLPLLLLCALVVPLLVLAAQRPGVETKPTYMNAFTRPYNLTIKIPAPNSVRGVTPQLTPPAQLSHDVVKLPSTPTRLDPRTCPGEFAYCYQVRNNTDERTPTYGKNYSATGSYALPQERVKLYLCVGNNTQCVAESTSCFCPTARIPPAPVVFSQHSKCSDTSHLCEYAHASFVLCEGNLSSCQEEYGTCGCGKYSVCSASKSNTCVNSRNELVVCNAAFADCVAKYPTCYCGTNMMMLQPKCTTSRHACQNAGTNVTCYGSFSSCAVKYERCEC